MVGSTCYSGPGGVELFVPIDVQVPHPRSIDANGSESSCEVCAGLELCLH